MKLASRLLSLALAAAGPVCATIVQVDDPSSGVYLNQQSFTYDGTSLAWRASLPIGSGFFIQAYDMMGSLLVSFGEWNGAPFAVTSNPVSFGASVQAAPSFQGQLQLSSVGATFSNRYYGIRYGVGGGSFQYGWINLSTSSNGALIHGIAFNTLTDDDIAAGQTAIPEPSAYAACAALAATAVVFGRRRRTSATAS